MNIDPLTVSRIPAPVRSRFDAIQVATDTAVLVHFPERLRQLLDSVPTEDLRGTYRPGGWTVAEIVHHLVDSHLNAYLRTKFALVDSHPTILPYDENRWVETPECSREQVRPASDLLAALHARWGRLLDGLSEEGWNRTFHHPEGDRDIALFQQVATYAWHGEHHLAQAALALRTHLPI